MEQGDSRHPAIAACRYKNSILESGPVGAGIVPVVAGMSRHEPVVPVRAGTGRLVLEPVPAEPAQARAGWCLSLPFGD